MRVTILRNTSLAVLAMGIAGLLNLALHAQQRGGTPAAPAVRQGPGFRLAPALYQQNCGTCHGTNAKQIDGKTAASISTLQDLSPERIYETITTGSMQTQAAALPEVQKRQIAEFLAARPMGSADTGDIKRMTNACASNPAMTDPAAGPSWNGWGGGPQNARFQTAAAAGLTAAQVPSLKLKWAFGLPNAAEMHSQPTAASGRVFFGSDAGYIYSVDAKTGCVYWSFHADSGNRTAPTVAPIKGQGTTRYAVYFVDLLTRVYALDAQTGKLLWKVKAGDHPRAKSSGSATVYDGRIYVPMSSMETTTGAVSTYECCSFRGHVVALDANTGQKIWRTFVIAEEPKPRGVNAQGVTLYGPAGGSVWNPPTIDAKRRRVYVGTGNAYTSPAAVGTDSVIALDMETGKVVWQHQEVKGDAFINNCRATGTPGDNCPDTLGPDYDFGGSALIMQTLPDGRDVLVAGTKGGLSIAFDLDKNGAVIWKTTLFDRPPGAAGLIVFGGTSDGTTVYYPLNQAGGIVAAINIADGSRKWTTMPFAGERGGSPAATSGIPGVVFTGALGGMFRAISSADGHLLWEFNTAVEFQTKNGITAKGGSLGQPGATIAGGMVFLGSGFVGGGTGSAGNVMLAFGPE
ncbi:MAG TPA: PQQ-binding-like beta-propeller repeat protein [Terriglobia bacterium]|nr:PQQ-binding-like beta-propeller repeat protein [Terriglobia bacterium]